MFMIFNLSWLLIHEMWNSILGLKGYCNFAYIVNSNCLMLLNILKIENRPNQTELDLI